MAARIVIETPPGSPGGDQGRIERDGLPTLHGPLPPTDAEARAVYASLIAAGVAVEPYVPPPPPGPPQQVPMWAAQAALKQAGRYDSINAAIVQMEASNPPVFFAWTMGNFASRSSAFIGALASQFGMSDADIDAVFVAADRIAQVAS